MRFAAPGLRVRVALIVTIPFVVVAAMLVYAFADDRAAHLANARERVLEVARALASEQRTALEVVRQFLVSAATLPGAGGADEAGACDRALVARPPAGASLAHLLIARPDGHIVCQWGHAPPPGSVSDLALFRRALDARDAHLGSYVDAWNDGTPPLALALAARSGEHVTAVLIAALSPQGLERDFAAAGLPAGSTVAVLDAEGRVFLRHPDVSRRAGQGPAPLHVPERIAHAGGPGAFDATGPDGVRRLYGYVPLFDDPARDLFLVVGIPRDAVVGPFERGFLLRLGLTLGLLTLMFAYVAYRGERLFVRPLLRLTWMAGEIARGRLSTRSGIAGGTPEMRRLAGALDAMADALEADRARLEHAHRALAQLDARLQCLPAAAMYVEADGRVGYANAACAAWATGTPGAMVGVPLRDLLAPEVLAAVMPHLEQARGGQAQHFQVDAPDRGGARRHADVLLMPEAGSGGGFLLFVHDATERHAQFEAMAHLAQVDALTGLPNRRTFLFALEGARKRAARARVGMGVLFLDIDRFKDINDTLGHRTGDLVLQAFAGVVVGASRRSDVVARLGGDEFAVLLEGLERPEALDVVVAAVRAALARPCTIEGRTMTLSASIGAAFAPPGREVSGEALLAEADAAMYRDKRARAFPPDAAEPGLDTSTRAVR